QSSTRYKEILEIADPKLPYILEEMKDDDFLVIMADHGNDPDIGHSKHTRECVPLLIKYKDFEGVHVGLRKTLSDVGASVCDYFGVRPPQNGTSFYREFK
ncbi:MAG: phosphopentomutase, partial [Erysipelotrichaceae bacterium]|nr:phosphopentomutase [Erysipelotrichaceae bacterium]